MDSLQDQKQLSRQIMLVIPLSLTLLALLAFKNLAQNGPERGTFTADSLVWSGDNHQIYLKGTMLVRFGKNKIRGTGSYSFLDEVYLLIVNDTKIPHDTPINLSGRKCELLKLTTQQAIERFGEAGNRGAVVITFAP